MEIIKLNNSIPRTYKNNGQHAEQIVRYTLTAKIEKADNTPYTVGGDVLDIQIKSQKATVCKGTDLKSYLDFDGAKRYGFVTPDFSTMYLMNRKEYEEFCKEFASLDHESGTHKEILRLKTYSKNMQRWFEKRA